VIIPTLKGIRQELNENISAIHQQMHVIQDDMEISGTIHSSAYVCITILNDCIIYTIYNCIYTAYTVLNTILF
jgi:hypothetical protein